MRRYWFHCIAWIALATFAIAFLHMAMTTPKRFAALEKKNIYMHEKIAGDILFALDRVERDIRRLGPGLQGHRHEILRVHFIRQQMQQTCRGAVLILGDSIVEGCHLLPVDGRLVVNGGIGSIGAKFLVEHIDEILACGDPGVVVLAIGVNDTRFVDGFLEPADRKRWRHLYDEIVGRIEKRSAEIILTTILPVEKDKPLGTKYFDFPVIEKLNEEIRDLARRKQLCLVDLYREFVAEDGFMATGGTIDGVHLSMKSYARWRALVLESVAACVQKQQGCRAGLGKIPVE